MKNKLGYLTEFKKLLSSYKMSASSKDLLNKVNLLLLVSPTAVGRNTIINELVKSGNYHYVVSDTTRKPRINNNIIEINGVEYWFKNEEEVLDGLKKGNYLEAAVIHDQQVSGISIRELERAKAGNKTAVTDIDVQGVKTIISNKSNTFVVFILPPSFKVWMQRLESRGLMPEDEKVRRLQSALMEYKTALTSGYYAFLVNDDLADTIHKLDQIVNSKISNMDYQQQGQKLAKQLKKETEEYLQNN